MDLSDYNKGFQWENMLVTVQNVTVYDGLTNAQGRVTGHITPDFHAEFGRAGKSRTS